MKFTRKGGLELKKYGIRINILTDFKKMLDVELCEVGTDKGHFGEVYMMRAHSCIT